MLPGITIGPWAMIGAGSVVTASVPAHAIARGNPARVVGLGLRVRPAAGAQRTPTCTIAPPATAPSTSRISTE